MPAAAAIPLAAGLLGAGAAGIASAAGVGRNSYRATTFDKSAGYDANRFNYGGNPGGADEAANRYRGWGEGAYQRGGPQADYSNANAYGSLSNYTRDASGDMAQLMAARARGDVPSIAGMQAQQDMQRAAAAQSAQAASARGAGGIALAQQQAANNTANVQGQISGQAQVNAAQERMAAEQAAYGAFANMRQGDVASQQQAAQQAQYQAGLEAQQRAANDQFALGMTQNEMAVRQQQLGAGMTQQQMLAQSLANQQALNMGVNQKNADLGMQYFQTGLGSVQGGVQGASMSGMGGGAPKGK